MNDDEGHRSQASYMQLPLTRATSVTPQQVYLSSPPAPPPPLAPPWAPRSLEVTVVPEGSLCVQANGSGRPPSGTPLPPTASKRDPLEDNSSTTARKLPQSGLGAASSSSRASSDSGRALASARSYCQLGPLAVAATGSGCCATDQKKLYCFGLTPCAHREQAVLTTAWCKLHQEGALQV